MIEECAHIVLLAPSQPLLLISLSELPLQTDSLVCISVFPAGVVLDVWLNMNQVDCSEVDLDI